MTQKYTTVRLLTSSYRLLKIEAAKRGIAMSTLLDQAVKHEIKTGRKTN